MYRSSERAGEMRKDNSNNNTNERTWSWKCGWQSAPVSKPEHGRRIDDGDGKSKRVDCTANIDTANSPLSPPPPPAGPTFGSSKATSYTNESFKTSARCKANLDSPSSFEVVGAVVQCTQSRCSSDMTLQVPSFLITNCIRLSWLLWFTICIILVHFVRNIFCKLHRV